LELEVSSRSDAFQAIERFTSLELPTLFDSKKVPFSIDHVDENSRSFAEFRNTAAEG
jgi:hypothetical protein